MGPWAAPTIADQVAVPTEHRGDRPVEGRPIDDENAASTATFLRLADRELGRGFRLAGYLLGTAADAEEATQEAILHAWKAWPGLRDQDRFGVWFERIVVNVCRDRIRRRGKVRIVELNEELGLRGPDPFADGLARDAIGRALALLSPDHRMVIVLRYWRDLPVEEIAERLDVPVGTVKSRIHYALGALRDAIAPAGLTEAIR